MIKKEWNENDFVFCFKVFHPAFRHETGAGVPQNMEVDQITSLVSIFSFEQHIIAAGNNKDNDSTSSTTLTTTTTSGESISTSPDTEAGSLESEKKSPEDDSDSESDTSSDSGHSSDDHDTSSDKEAKEEELSDTSALSDTSKNGLTKLTRSVSTPDLCSASVSASGISSDSPICVEVASVWCRKHYLIKKTISSFSIKIIN